MAIYYKLYISTIMNQKNQILNKMEMSIYKNIKDNSFIYQTIKTNKELNILFESKNNYFAFFYNKKNILKISIKKDEFRKINSEKLEELTLTFIYILLSNITFSLLLIGYILNPIRENLKELDDFLKDISHDINTPITSMKINLLLLGKSQENQKKYIERLNISLENIIFLQKNLEQYDNKILIKNEEIILENFFKNKIKYFDSLYPLINVKLVSLNERTIIKTDIEKFNRLFDNLISNACKYTNKKDIVKILILKDKIILIDSGKGIKQPNKIFDRFYKEGQNGLGLGLNIVKKIVSQLNYKIKVKSKEGKGTKITLILK